MHPMPAVVCRRVQVRVCVSEDNLPESVLPSTSVGSGEHTGHQAGQRVPWPLSHLTSPQLLFSGQSHFP